MLDEGETAIRRMVKASWEDVHRDNIFLFAMEKQELWDAMAKLQSTLQNQVFQSVAMLKDGSESVDARLRRLERHVMVEGEGKPLMEIQQSVDTVGAGLKEVEQDVVRLVSEMTSHVREVSGELAGLEATKAAVLKLEERLSQTETDLARFMLSTTTQQQEMRQAIAEDFLTVATKEVRTVGDLKSSQWRKTHPRPLPLDVSVPGEESPKVSPLSSPDVAVRFGDAALETSKRISKVTDVSESPAHGWLAHLAGAFSRKVRFSRMEAGCTYQLKLSVWDGSLFFGLAGFRKVDHVLFGQALCLNAALQACVCVLVYHLGIDNRKQFADERVDAFKRWRIQSDETDWAGVCSLDFATSTNYLQLSTKENVDNYYENVFDGFPVGPVLCRIVIILWSATVVNLLRDLADCAVALVQLTDWNTRSTKVSHGLRSYTVHSIPPLRLAFMLVNVFFQLCVVLVLLIWGSLWLVNTTELSELLLNSVALGFITDTDELLFQALVPNIVKGMTLNIEPLALVPPGRLPPLRSILSACTVVSASMVAHFTIIADVEESLSSVNEAMCP